MNKDKDINKEKKRELKSKVLEHVKDYPDDYKKQVLTAIKNKKSITKLTIDCIEIQDNELVLILLEFPNISLEYHNEYGNSLLSTAIDNNALLVLKRLLEFEDISLRINVVGDNVSALEYACNDYYSSSNEKIISLLLKDKRLDVNEKNEEGNTMLKNIGNIKKEVLQLILANTEYRENKRDIDHWEFEKNMGLFYVDKEEYLNKIDMIEEHFQLKRLEKQLQCVSIENKPGSKKIKI